MVSSDAVWRGGELLVRGLHPVALCPKALGVRHEIWIVKALCAALPSSIRILICCEFIKNAPSWLQREPSLRSDEVRADRARDRPTMLDRPLEMRQPFGSPTDLSFDLVWLRPRVMPVWGPCGLGLDSTPRECEMAGGPSGMGEGLNCPGSSVPRFVLSFGDPELE